eukprot:jgi/Tetstr1/429022/TSEL_018987.t1
MVVLLGNGYKDTTINRKLVYTAIARTRDRLYLIGSLRMLKRFTKAFIGLAITAFLATRRALIINLGGTDGVPSSSTSVESVSHLVTAADSIADVASEIPDLVEGLDLLQKYEGLDYVFAEVHNIAESFEGLERYADTADSSPTRCQTTRVGADQTEAIEGQIQLAQTSLTEMHGKYDAARAQCESTKTACENARNTCSTDLASFDSGGKIVAEGLGEAAPDGRRVSQPLRQPKQHAVVHATDWRKHDMSEESCIVKDLARLSWLQFLSHLRRTNNPIDRSLKITTPHDLHATQWGYLCPMESPYRVNVGMTNNLALLCFVTVDSSLAFLDHEIMSQASSRLKAASAKVSDPTSEIARLHVFGGADGTYTRLPAEDMTAEVSYVADHQDGHAGKGMDSECVEGWRVLMQALPGQRGAAAGVAAAVGNGPPAPVSDDGGSKVDDVMGVGEDPVGEDGMDTDAPAWPPAGVEPAMRA